jgi:hypothetical protein
VRDGGRKRGMEGGWKEDKILTLLVGKEGKRESEKEKDSRRERTIEQEAVRKGVGLSLILFPHFSQLLLVLSSGGVQGRGT